MGAPEDEKAFEKQFTDGGGEMPDMEAMLRQFASGVTDAIEGRGFNEPTYLSTEECAAYHVGYRCLGRALLARFGGLAVGQAPQAAEEPPAKEKPHGSACGRNHGIPCMCGLEEQSKLDRYTLGYLDRWLEATTAEDQRGEVRQRMLCIFSAVAEQGGGPQGLLSLGWLRIRQMAVGW